METVPWHKDLWLALSPPHAARFYPHAAEGRVGMGNSAFRLSLYVSAALLALGRAAGAVLALAGGSLAAYALGEEPLRPDPPAAGGGAGPRTQPTPDNPYMNVLVGAPPTRPAAADVTLPSTQAAVLRAAPAPPAREDRLFDADPNRAFYTTASTTVPNDQAAFASYLYSSPPTLKERAF